MYDIRCDIWVEIRFYKNLFNLRLIYLSLIKPKGFVGLTRGYKHPLKIAFKALKMNRIVNSLQELSPILKSSLVIGLIVNLPFIRDVFLSDFNSIVWKPWTLWTNSLITEFYFVNFVFIISSFQLHF